MTHDARSPALEHREFRRQAVISRTRRAVVAILGSIALLLLLGALDEHDRKIFAAERTSAAAKRQIVTFDNCPQLGAPPIITPPKKKAEQ